MELPRELKMGEEKKLSRDKKHVFILLWQILQALINCFGILLIDGESKKEADQKQSSEKSTKIYNGFHNQHSHALPSVHMNLIPPWQTYFLLKNQQKIYIYQNILTHFQYYHRLSLVASDCCFYHDLQQSAGH